MAAKTTVPSKEQQDRTRAAIKTSQLVNRLQNFALASAEDETIVLDKDRLKAIEILLKKSLPDLSSVTLEGGEKPIELINTINRRIVRPDENS